MNYGIPYMGSKNAIARKIIDILPSADVFVDLFAGGCAITHAAMLSNKYKTYIINDISNSTQLFKNAVSGVYSNETRWISRDIFNNEHEHDAYIRYVWSFGNNGKDYLYGEHIEEWKHAVWNARVLGDVRMLRDMGIYGDGSVEDIKAHKEKYSDKYITWYYEKLHNMPVPTEEQMRRTAEHIEKSKDILLGMLRKALRVHNVSQSQVCQFLGNYMASHYFTRSQWAFPTPENYAKLRVLLPSLPELEGYADYATYKRLQSVQSVQRLQRLKRLQMLQMLESLQSLQSLQSLHNLESLQRLQRLQMLHNLQSLDRLKRLKRLQVDYRDVALPTSNAIIYCDPPYKNTIGYNITFDHDAFYDWCDRQTLPLFISEYNMPGDRFICVAEFSHINSFSSTRNTRVIERLFVPKHQYKQRTIPTQLTLF